MQLVLAEKTMQGLGVKFARVGIVGGEWQPKDDGDHRAKKISFLIHFYRKAPQVCLCCPKMDQNIISI